MSVPQSAKQMRLKPFQSLSVNVVGKLHLPVLSRSGSDSTLISPVSWLNGSFFAAASFSSGAMHQQCADKLSLSFVGLRPYPRL